MPEIPDRARRTIRGKVTVNVRVDVDPSGKVTDAKVESPGASRYFSDRTLKAVRQWKFKPISVNGSESGQRWRIQFQFLTSGTKVQPKRLSP
jgi:TonB family protein